MHTLQFSPVKVLNPYIVANILLVLESAAACASLRQAIGKTEGMPQEGRAVRKSGEGERGKGCMEDSTDPTLSQRKTV